VSETIVLLLLGFAGVTATFAGFSAAVAVFGHHAQGEWNPVERFRLTVMLATALAACFFSFLPLVIAQAHLSETRTWTIDSALLGVFCVILMAVIPAARKRVNRALPGASPTWFYVLFVVAFSLTTLVQASNVAGVPFGHEPLPYLSGLFVLWMMAASEFAFLVLVPLSFAKEHGTGTRGN
jgi:hypothetical protein